MALFVRKADAMLIVLFFTYLSFLIFVYERIQQREIVCNKIPHLWILPQLSSCRSLKWRNKSVINPLVTNERSHPYHLDKST